MKKIITSMLLTICILFTSCAATQKAVTSLGNGITSLAQNKTLVADAGIALSVATQYELIAKIRKVTVADYIVITQSAVAQYTAAQTESPSAATLNDWIDTATKAVVAYDASKGTSAP